MKREQNKRLIKGKVQSVSWRHRQQRMHRRRRLHQRRPRCARRNAINNGKLSFILFKSSDFNPIKFKSLSRERMRENGNEWPHVRRSGEKNERTSENNLAALPTCIQIDDR